MRGGRALSIPAKHTTGRYWAPDPVLDELEANGQVVLRYARRRELQRLLAGHRRRCRTRRATSSGLMPHPEHAVDLLTGSADGLKLFESAARVPA